MRISHDALLTCWARLRDWIAESRGDLDTLAKLRRAAEVWVDSERDPDALIPVHRLTAFTSWLDAPEKLALLTGVERAYLDASEEHFATALDAERRNGARLQRQRRLAVGLAALTTVLAMLAGLAWVRGEGFQAQALASRNEAQSRQVATTATTLRAKDPNLYAQLSVVAGTLADTQEARTAIIGATGVDAPLRWSGPAGGVLAASADGRLIARGDGTGRVTMWRGDELTASPGTGWPVDDQARALYAVAVARVAGQDLLAVAGDGFAALWDVTAEPKRVADLATGGRAVAFAPDGSLLALGDGAGLVRIWRITGSAAPRRVGGIELDETTADGVASRPAVSSVGIDAHRVLYVGGPAGALSRWRLGDAEPERLPDLDTTFVAGDGTRTPAPVQALAISADGKRLAAGIAGRQVFRWRLDGVRATPQAGLRSFTSWVNGVAFSADGTRLVAASSDQHVSIYDADSGEELRRLVNPAVMTAAVLVGGRPVAVGVDGALRVWPAQGPVWRLGGSVVYNLSSDGTDWLAGGTPEDGIVLWRLGEPLRRFPVPEPQLPDGDTQVGAVAVAPSAKYLLGGTAQGRVLSWPLSADGPGEVRITGGGIGYLAFVAVSPDSSLVAAMEYQGTHTVLFRARPDGSLRRLASIETPDPQLFGFSADGSVLAVALGGRRVALWSVADPERPAELGAFTVETVPTTLNVAPLSARLAVGEESGTVSIWDFADPAKPVRTRTFADPNSAMYSLAFSPDEHTLLGTSGDDLIWGWDLAEGVEHAAFALDGDLGRPWDVRFIEGGRRFAVSGDSGRVRVWTAGLDDARRELCEGRGEPLTAGEWQRYLPGVEPRDPC